MFVLRPGRGRGLACRESEVEQREPADGQESGTVIEVVKLCEQETISISNIIIIVLISIIFISMIVQSLLLWFLHNHCYCFHWYS